MLFLILTSLMALAMVLSIGTTLMELLIRDAPRRGKRPDVTDDPALAEVVLRVVTTDGQTLVGHPRTIVEQLRAEGFSPAPRFLTASAARKTLERWERNGLVHVRGEWRELR
jgi:hypothetical protein